MRIKSVVLLCCCLAFGGRMASACDTFRPAEPASNIGFWCHKDWMDYYWDAYDFDKGDWDDGFGWSVPCDLHRPLGRTFQAIEMLNYAAPDDALEVDDFSGSFLRWAGNYTIYAFDELDGRCSNGTSDHAYTTWGTIDDTAELYMGFFYNENVVQRASLLVHESRHAGWCSHNGNDGSDACPSKSHSCDESFNDGCTGAFSVSGMGADGFQVVWLWWYLREADPQHSNVAMRANARDTANGILDTMFDDDPCFHLSKNGDKIKIC